MTYALGQTVELSFATTPAETGTLAVTRPDGTPYTATVTGPAGAQLALVDPDQLGTWSYVWTSPNAGAQVGTFAVGQQLVTLADVKAHLNITSTKYDAELPGFIDAATQLVEGETGPILPRTVTEQVFGSVLSTTPVLSVGSVTWLGGTYTGTLNAGAGLLTGIPAGATVTYTAGRASVPALARLVTLDVVGYLWQSQRGSLPLRPGAPDDVDDPAPAPRLSAILSQLGPLRRGPVVA